MSAAMLGGAATDGVSSVDAARTSWVAPEACPHRRVPAPWQPQTPMAGSPAVRTSSFN